MSGIHRSAAAALLGSGILIAAAIIALVIVHAFGSTSCTQGQSGDQPPPAGATAWAKADATVRAGWSAFATEQASSLSQSAADDDVAQWTPDLTGLTPQPQWGFVYPPQPPAGTATPMPTPPPSVGGLTALSDCAP